MGKVWTKIYCHFYFRGITLTVWILWSIKFIRELIQFTLKLSLIISQLSQYAKTMSHCHRFWPRWNDRNFPKNKKKALKNISKITKGYRSGCSDVLLINENFRTLSKKCIIKDLLAPLSKQLFGEMRVWSIKDQRNWFIREKWWFIYTPQLLYYTCPCLRSTPSWKRENAW